MDRPVSEQWHMALEAARRYEDVVAKHVLGPWAAPLVDAARVARGERVLDLACGTGVVARAAAKRAGREGRVLGVDLNPGMIAVARSLPAPEGAAIEWQEGSALAIPLVDASVDAVLCQQGLQFFPDRALALREMRRVLAQGGRVAASVWTGTGIYNGALGRALARFVDESTAARFCASRKVPAKDELQRVAGAAGFSSVDVRAVRMDIHLPRLDRFALEHLAATPVAGSIAALGPDARAGLAASVVQELQRFAHGDGVTYPEEIHLITASI